MHVFSKRSFLCRHIAGICSIFITGFLPGICSKFLTGFLPKFLAHIPGRIPASNLVQIPGRIPANLNISLQIPQGVHTDSCHNLYKKNQTVNMIPARNLVSFSCGNTAVFLLDNFVQDPARAGLEPRSPGWKSGVITRLKGPDQLDWSIMHPIYCNTKYFAAALPHSSMLQ